jgi:hypothetical protein
MWDENHVDVQNEDTVSAGASVSVAMLDVCSCGTAIALTRGPGTGSRWPAFGCARVVFHDGLRPAEARGRAAALPTRKWRDGGQEDERQWLGEVSAVVLQQALADLNAAYRNFFASVKGERKSGRAGPPRLRSRKDRRQAIRFTANARFTVLPNGRLRLPKIGDVAVRWSRPLPAAPSSVTVIRDAAGRYFASFVETDPAADAGASPNRSW